MPPVHIRASELRHTITILQPSTARDGNGELLAPVKVADCYASVKQISGQQYYKDQQFISDANYEIFIRYRRGIVANMTVIFKGRNFIIRYLDPNVEERNVKTILYCKEVL